MDLQQLTQIDYGLYSDTERAQLVTQLLNNTQVLHQIEENFTNPSVQAQQEGLANYIMYGKNKERGTNSVQEKKVKIHTKYATYAKRPEESQDELLASPAFDEGAIHDLYVRNTYTKPKQGIRRPTYDSLGNEIDPGDGDLPTMRQQWYSIDLMAHKLALALGKEEPDDGEEKPNWSSLQQYKMRHWLIDLRKHQYYIREAYRPLIPTHSSFTERPHIDWCSNSGYWRNVVVPPPEIEYAAAHNSTRIGRKSVPDESRQQWVNGQLRLNRETSKVEEYHLVRSHILDFKNPLHVYHLLNMYDRLWKESWDDLNGQMKTILLSFDEVGRKTEFTEAQLLVLDCKVAHWTNERIQLLLQEKLGQKYNVNYISTLFKRTICEKISATAARLEREHQAEDKPDNWKRCSTCGRTLLRDKVNFVRKASSSDGQSARCKQCDKNMREGRPIGYGNSSN